MKKIGQLAAMTMVVLAAQACGSKNKEYKEDTASEMAAASNASTPADITAKHEANAKALAEKEQARKMALAENAKKNPTYKDKSGKTVYALTEINPAYQGGPGAIRTYVFENLNYPEEAKQNGTEGTVFVDFTVDEYGKVRDVETAEVIGDVDQAMKDEAVRVVSSMPAWIAGKHNGKAVDTRFSLL